MAKIDEVSDAILAKVEEQDTVLDSIETLMANLSQQIKDAAEGLTPAQTAKFKTITDVLDKNRAQMADIVVKNTPAEPTP